MSRKSLRSRGEIALQHLTGTAPTNEDSEDELGIDHQDWEWIYADEVREETHTPSRKRKASAAFSTPTSKRIVGARNRNFECRIGDALLLKAERNDVWVAIVQEFLEDREDGTKSAMFMWFISPQEIHNKAKRRTDVMPVRTALGTATAPKCKNLHECRTSCTSRKRWMTTPSKRSRARRWLYRPSVSSRCSLMERCRRKSLRKHLFAEWAVTVRRLPTPRSLYGKMSIKALRISSHSRKE